MDAMLYPDYKLPAPGIPFQAGKRALAGALGIVFLMVFQYG